VLFALKFKLYAIKIQITNIAFNASSIYSRTILFSFCMRIRICIRIQHKKNLRFFQQLGKYIHVYNNICTMRQNE
jgi:hypothetical protein